MKDTLIIPLHFALPLLHHIKTKGTLVDDLQSTGNPAPGKMASRCVAPPVFCEPAGDMMAGRDACETLGLKVANLPEETRLELKDLL